MLIATFNANSIRARIEQVVRWLQRRRPDILCLQETKVEDKDFPLSAFQEAGYHVVFRGERSYNGVAIASRTRPDHVQFGLDDSGPPDETRLVCARFGRVHVVNTYVPQGREIEHPMYQYKLEWLRRLKAYFARHFTPRLNVLWVGDLNVAPLPIDVHNPERQTKHVCYHVAVRQAFEETVVWGFVDVFRKHHPEGGHYTFFDYRTPKAVEKKMGWRVDHILATPPLASKCVDCYIDLKPRLEPNASDHTFLVAKFTI